MFSLFKLPLRKPIRRPIVLQRAYLPMGQFGGAGNDIFYNGGDGAQGPQGPAGVSVVGANVQPNPGELYITLSDGTVINAGNVIGPEGPQGPQGPAGSTSNILNVILVKQDYTITSNDQYIGATEKNITITLPLGILGRVYYVKNESNGNIKVVGTSGQTIDGSAFQTLGTNNGFMVVFDGSRWNIL